MRAMRGLPTLAILGVMALASSPMFAQSTIDAVDKSAWTENVGWTNWRDAGGSLDGVAVEDTFLSGFVWAENVGWINLGDGPVNGTSYANTDGSDFGVNRAPGGDLSGFGWGENIGWVNFDTSVVGADRARFESAEGRFRGYAWGENVGWINLDHGEHFVGAADLTRCSDDTPSAPFGDVGQPSTLSSTILVDQSGVVVDTQVTLDVTHTFVGDLVIELTSAGSSTVRLHDGGGGAADAIFVTYHDGGLPNGTPYDCGCAMQPSGPGVLEDFAGGGTVGGWTLDIVDMFPNSDGGTLEAWCLQLNSLPNDPPEALDDSYEVLSGETLTVSAPGVLDNDSDPDMDMLTASLVSGPSSASSFTLNPDGSFTYTHDGSGAGTDSFDYEASDGLGNTDVATVTIDVSSSSPEFLRGDFDGNGVFNGVVDGIGILNFQFVPGSMPPACLEAADADGNGVFNGILDGLRVLNHQFTSGPPPADPYPACGPDPDLPSSLGCDSHPGCP